ncbi:MAG: hybrid sensor histidine kinase/response regulator [Victivallaceae bacterium]|nr:hybrid sensor histidine kinase/response regulator [Victivallaceae bacterium]
MEQNFNTRILVIDDEENVRDCFRKILQPLDVGRELYSRLDEASAVLFDSPRTMSNSLKRSSATFDFEMEEASNGKQGYEMIKKAVEANRPYAAVFVDMRMPGWDGLETVEHLRKIDKRCEVIFVTAYSDYSIKEIVTAVGTNVSYHCKPFSVEEIEQIATKAVYEWNKTRNLEDLIKTISNLHTQQWQMQPLLKNILQQVSYLMGTHSAMIALAKEKIYQKLLAIGNLCNDKIADAYLYDISRLPDQEVFQNDIYACFKLNKYGILAIFEKGGKPLNQERTYLVRLFLEQAVLSIQNVGLQEKLLRQEKLSAVGEATGMIVHDLRNSIGLIEAFIDITIQKIDDREYVIDNLKLIKDAARNGMSLAQDILDYTSNKNIEKSLINSKNLADEMHEKVRTLCEKKEIKFDILCPKDFIFNADYGKMSRALLNLINNAIESYTSCAVNSEMCLELQRDKDSVNITFSDNGPGIPVEIANDIFTPFVTHGKSGGTGLGLAITKQIIEAHNGTINVKSSPHGTVFKITIPDK